MSTPDDQPPPARTPADSPVAGQVPRPEMPFSIAFPGYLLAVVAGGGAVLSLAMLVSGFRDWVSYPGGPFSSVGLILGGLCLVVTAVAALMAVATLRGSSVTSWLWGVVGLGAIVLGLADRSWPAVFGGFVALLFAILLRGEPALAFRAQMRTYESAQHRRREPPAF